MPIKITTAKEVALRHGIKMILYGEAGSGKTTLAASLDNVLVISAENGLLSLAGHDVPVIEVNTMQEFGEAYQFCLSPEASEYHTIYLDSISEIAEQILTNEKAVNRDARQAYGGLIEQVISLIKAFRDLSGKHVVLVCKSETYAPDGAAPVIRPSMPGSRLSNELPYLVDEVLFLKVNFDGTRVIQTQPDGIHIAKDRSGKLDPKGEPGEQGLQTLFNKILGQTA